MLQVDNYYENGEKKQASEPSENAVGINMSLVEEGGKNENIGEHELKDEANETYQNRKQDLDNINLALPLSHFWSCKVFFYFFYFLNNKFVY